MATHRATPHTTTGETPNYLALGRETRLPNSLVCGVDPGQLQSRHEYPVDLEKRWRVVHEALRNQQKQVRIEDGEECPRFRMGNKVLMKNYQKERGKMGKLQPKYLGPYQVIEAYLNHSYKIEGQGKETT